MSHLQKCLEEVSCTESLYLVHWTRLRWLLNIVVGCQRSNSAKASDGTCDVPSVLECRPFGWNIVLLW